MACIPQCAHVCFCPSTAIGQCFLLVDLKQNASHKDIETKWPPAHSFVIQVSPTSFSTQGRGGVLYFLTLLPHEDRQPFCSPARALEDMHHRHGCVFSSLGNPSPAVTKRRGASDFVIIGTSAAQGTFRWVEI